MTGRILESLPTCCRAAVSPSRGGGERSGFPQPTDEPLQTHPLRPGPLPPPAPRQRNKEGAVLAQVESARRQAGQAGRQRGHGRRWRWRQAAP